MGTFVAKREDLTRKWFVIDADGQALGRVAVEAAKLLRGKHKPIFTPNVDCGDHVIIVNAAKAVLTGNGKASEPIYHHSGYPGGLKRWIGARCSKRPRSSPVMKAVKGMLPHNKLGDAMLKKLRVYAGPDHTQEAQQPVKFELS